MLLLRLAHLAISAGALEGLLDSRAHVQDFVEHPLGVPTSLPQAMPQRRAHAEENVLQGVVQNPCRTNVHVKTTLYSKEK